MSKVFRTDRLLLRQWEDEDRQILAAINNDPEIMHYFPRRFTEEESHAFVDVNAERIANNGWGSWAVETIKSGEFIGFVGFSYPAEWHPCAGNIEIGWRLCSQHWGRGYATEAAKFALGVGFELLGFEEVVSFTSECNLPSINVMRKIGLHHDGVGFEHPRIDIASPLRKHVVYRLEKGAYSTRQRDCAEPLFGKVRSAI